MKKIKGEFGERFIEISGGKKEIEKIDEAIKKLEEIDESNGTISQIFNAEKIAGESHLLHASKLALEALERGESFADTPRIELTCWTAGLRQINKALDRVGVEKNSEEIAIVSIGEEKEGVEKAQKAIFQELDIKEKQTYSKLRKIK